MSKAEAVSLDRPSHFRAFEPVARCLIRRLLLPNVYYEAPWPTEHKRVDLLLIDRAGAGDVHVVGVKEAPTSVPQAARELLGTPAQYYWIAYFATGRPVSARSMRLWQETLRPHDGPGRLGFIEVVTMSDGSYGANIAAPAERFRGNLFEQADRFAASHRPDIEFR